ncbi:30S ribosomal protein S1 [bioreactor metagenome]|uniref:30S ribosomal protein S1 n=1 Tax=bioreactor metagenome TaxID=1076179 RepID=A0A645BYW8_9ZZZZ
MVLSQRNIVNKKNWDEIVAKHEAGEFVEGVGKEAVKGGLLADVMGIRTFIPASQLSMRYVEKITEFVGQGMKLKIIEVDKAKKRIVASRKAVLIADEAEKKQAVWDTLKEKEGQVVEGTVRRLADFGAFVDIGGVDGMVHISELSWSRIKTPSEVCKVGDSMEVYVISFDAEKRKISLGVKDRGVNPWEDFMSKYRVGDVATVRIVKLMTFGAFAEVVPGVDGLIHISQIADRRIEKPGDVLSEGQEVEAEIIAVDEEKKKISLSIRALLAPAAQDESETEAE